MIDFKLYKLKIVPVIEAHGLTIMEVSAKTGLSSRAIHRFDNKNDCNFSDLYILSQAIGCPLSELYEITDEKYAKKARKVVNRERKLQRREEVITILKKHLPEEISFIAQCLSYEEIEIANRLWNNRLSNRAIANVNRKAKNESYIADVQLKIMQLKQSLSAESESRFYKR